MAESAASTARLLDAWFQRGQALENEGRLDEALATYDNALALLRVAGNAADLPTRHALGLAWMNRGNALQKIATAVSLADAVHAYDEAIATFRSLPVDTEPALRNQLGAAWLNRGHALVHISEDAAITSFENALHELAQLPLETDPFFRLNLAGAHTNLAHATLARSAATAADSARTALAVLAGFERAHEAFAGMSLRARRALVMALGTLLTAAEAAREPIAALASEATDAIDDGLALARDLEAHGLSHLRPLAQRLFRLGAQLYGVHQPHFLGEFVLETLATPAFAADAEFHAIAQSALTQALAHAQRPQLILAGTADPQRLLDTAHSLRAALAQLSALSPQLSTSVP